MRQKSHEVIDVDSCPVLVSALQESASLLKPLARLVLKSDKPIDLGVTATLSGLDVDIRGHGPASPELRMKLTREAEALDLARLSLHGDVIVERRAPKLHIGKADVTLPPGSFLQATESGEAALQQEVLSHLKEPKRVADLFAGIGTFALRLAEYASVHAVETEASSIHALARATRDVAGLKPITTETRDLFRRPLVPQELNTFDHVVIDPPRAGAEAQMRLLASSSVARVISVSCYLGSFQRDAALLLAGGYQLVKVSVIDQFRYSTHCETVALFEREPTKAKAKRRRLLG
jgi:23S rRNA (uracil1939-C5)-methyltransferase